MKKDIGFAARVEHLYNRHHLGQDVGHFHHASNLPPVLFSQSSAPLTPLAVIAITSWFYFSVIVDVQYYISFRSYFVFLKKVYFI